MSDDWARIYIVIHKQKQQEKQNAQRKATLAEAVAPDAFQKIRERIRLDLSTFHKDEVFSRVYLGEQAFKRDQAFEVISAGPFPETKLIVQLNIVVIQYRYIFPETKEKHAEEKHGTLRIGSDLNGEVKIYRNGDSFTDESEVSEFLLKPLLDHIDG